MAGFSQGDIIKIGNYKELFLVVSKNAFIKAAKVFHVCPLLPDVPEGPLHIKVCGNKGTGGIAIIEQVKMIEPAFRRCVHKDRIGYSDIMEVSDALQGVFEYD